MSAGTERRRSPRTAWLPAAVLAPVILFALLFYGEARSRSCIATWQVGVIAIADIDNASHGFQVTPYVICT